MTERGRPTKYRDDFSVQAEKLSKLGATDEELANFFEVDPATVYRWKNDHQDFCEAITRGKVLADAEVADKLYQRACGYTHKAVKIFNNGGEPLIVDHDEHYPPDTQAASLWLRNRQPEKWRDKQTLEHTGSFTVNIEGDDADCA